MEKRPISLNAIAEEAGKGAKALWGKTKDSFVKVADQNNDGTFDMEDVTAIAETISLAAQNTANAVKAAADERRRALEKEQLQPIFTDDLDSADFLISKLIRITDIDKRRAESDVCKGSIGFVSVQKDLRIVSIFRDKIDAFGLSFYPDMDCELYYIDPSDRDRYIALDDYFNFLRIARVDELQKIAQDLGAKHFRVTYKEQKTTFSSNTAKGKGTYKQLGSNATMEAEHDLSSSAMATVEVAAEMECPGHAPCMPKLKYLQKEHSIQNLIALRMDETSPIMHQKYTLNLINSSGIKEKDAVKIDAALKAMKIAGNTTVTSEVRNESRRFFEYEIDF